jgi:hypothetical protein
MSAGRNSTPAMTRGAGKRSAPRSAVKSISKATPSRRRSGNQFPDLEAIVFAFADAQALVTVTYKAVAESDIAGAEANVLRMAVEALDRISDQLDEAEMQLDRFRRENASAQAGVS